MRVKGNAWEDNWHNARSCPVRRQKRLFDETKEAEKVLIVFLGIYLIKYILFHYIPRPGVGLQKPQPLVHLKFKVNFPTPQCL
jgi:hypothetical protein